MRARVLSIVATLAVLGVTGCGGGSSNTTPPPPPAPVISISVSPPSAALAVGGTQQFTATVTGTTNTAASWLVSSPRAPAGTDIGSVSSSGLYTAPFSVSANLTINVMATSEADPTKSATAIVTVAVPTQPVLLWQKDDFQGSSFRPAVVDANGNLITGGFYFSNTSVNTSMLFASYSPNGNLRWSFNNNQELGTIFGGLILPDGSSWWTGATGPAATEMPMLLGLTNGGEKLFENTCSATSAFWPITQANGRVYLGGWANNATAIFTTDTNGNIDCANPIVVKNDPSARIMSLWTNGTYILAAGDFYSKPAGSLLDHAGYVVKLDLATKQVLWEKDFQDIAGTARVVVVTENNQDVIYFTGHIMLTNGYHRYTTKMDADGSVLQGWPQIYPNPLIGATGQGEIMANPAGNGVIVAGGDCTLIAYSADGTTRWDAGQIIPNGTCQDTVVFGTSLYLAGAINLDTDPKTMAARIALPQQ